MRTVLKSKRVSYGLVELIDGGTSYARYRIEVNGNIKEVSDDLSYLSQLFERNYF
ncbi:MAG: hypothetical protein ACOYBL_10575 [Lachnospiraceae bacterium]|jgi:hypothetical protein